MAMAQGEDTKGRGTTGRENEGQNAGEDAALQARLSRLSSALDQHQNSAGPDEMKVPDLSGQSLSATNLGFRVLVEFISAIVVGALIGWQIDKWAHTGPIFLILFLCLGMAAGLVNIYRIAAGPKPKRG
jgi:ATP synthase protein I